MGFNSNLRRSPGIAGVSTVSQAEEQAEALYQSDKKAFSTALFAYDALNRTAADEVVDYLSMCALKSYGRKCLRSIPVLGSVPLAPLIPVLENFLKYLGTFNATLRPTVHKLAPRVIEIGKVILSALKSDDAEFDPSDYFRFSILADLLLTTAISANYTQGKFLNVNNVDELNAVKSDCRPLIISSAIEQDSIDNFLKKFPRSRFCCEGTFAPLYKQQVSQGLFFGSCSLPPCDLELPFKYGLVRSMVYGEALPRPILVRCIITLLKSTVSEEEPVEAATVFLSNNLERGVLEGSEALLANLIPLIEKKGEATPEMLARIPDPTAKQTKFKVYFRSLRKDFRVNPLLLLVEAARKFVLIPVPIAPEIPQQEQALPQLPEVVPAPEVQSPQGEEAVEKKPANKRKKRQNRKKQAKKTPVENEILVEDEIKSSVSQTSDLAASLSIQANVVNSMLATLIDRGVIQAGPSHPMKQQNPRRGPPQHRNPKWKNQTNNKGNNRGGDKVNRAPKKNPIPVVTTPRVGEQGDIVSILTNGAARG